MRRASGFEPTAFDASVNATIFVRSLASSASSASMSSVASSGRSGTVWTVSAWSSAMRSHGDTLPSWSSCVTTISSPSFSVRATACASRKLSVVMFGAERDLLRPRAGEVGGGLARLVVQRDRTPRSVTKAPPRLAFEPRR